MRSPARGGCRRSLPPWPGSATRTPAGSSRPAEPLEQANRRAGLAARHAADEVAALEATRPALADTLRSESLHLEWVEGDRLRLVIGENDPLQGHAPGWLSLAGTRTAEALLQGKPLREPLPGRRPEDLFGVPAGLRQLAVARLRSAGPEGALQAGRRP